MLKEIPKSTKQISFNANVLLKISKHHSKGSLYRENEAFFTSLIISMEPIHAAHPRLFKLARLNIKYSDQIYIVLFSTIKLSSFT